MPLLLGVINLKKRLFVAVVASFMLTTTSFGHVTAPIKPLGPENFHPVAIPTVLETFSPKISDFRAPKHQIKRFLPEKPKNIAKIEQKVKIKAAPSTTSAQIWAKNRLGTTQYNCLYLLFKRESNWRVNAYNKSSGAYGIPQALPGSKMAKAGADWKTNPITQVKWGLGYIHGRYGTPCKAWVHSQRTGWY